MHSKHPALGVKFIILLLVHCTSLHATYLISVLKGCDFRGLWDLFLFAFLLVWPLEASSAGQSWLNKSELYKLIRLKREIKKPCKLAISIAVSASFVASISESFAPFEVFIPEGFEANADLVDVEELS